MSKTFFDTVRPLFGKLSQDRVDGMNRIILYAQDNAVSRVHLAYILATVFHETAAWMQPIREGARRYGTNYTDARSRRAVAAIHAKGIISRNYALPDAAGNSFYGRGLVQITHKYNYEQFGIADDPERALEWEKALEITFRGMRGGMFRKGHSLATCTDTHHNYVAARGIINGDVRKYGVRVAQYADTFYAALEDYVPHAVVKEKSNDTSNQGSYRPAWWPF